MKKYTISMFGAVAMMAVAPCAFADDAPVTNTKAKFPHGVQIGMGVSATSGLNGFIGYANKDFDSFWAKRFGVRLDFASTRPIKSAINSGVDSFMGDDGIDIGDNLTIKDGEIKSYHAAALLDFYLSKLSKSRSKLRKYVSDPKRAMPTTPSSSSTLRSSSATATR